MTAESTVADVQSLTSQILDSKKAPAPEQKKVEAQPAPVEKRPVFAKGEQNWDIPDDAEIEVRADHGTQKLTLRELKDRAAGDIAVKNRMQSLADEKRKVQGTWKEFTAIAKKDPLRALEYISERAKEADSEFEYNSYLGSLADQAEKLSKMTDAERRAYKAEQKLEKAQQDLSTHELEQKLVERKTAIMGDFNLKDSQFDDYLDTVVNTPALMQGLKTEEDVLNRVQDLALETANQIEIQKILQKVDPSQAKNEKLILSMADVMRKVPDMTQEEIKQVLEEWTAPNRKTQQVQRLSDRQRQSMPSTEGMTPFDILAAQIEEDKAQKKTRR